MWVCSCVRCMQSQPWPHLLQSWCHVRGRGNGECWLMLCCDQCMQRDRQSMMGYIADAMHGAWSRYDLVVVVQPELSTTFWGFGWLWYSCHWLCCGKHWAQLCSCNAARTFILLQPLLSANLIILHPIWPAFVYISIAYCAGSSGT